MHPVRQKRRPTHVWLHGRPGIGKTAVAQAVIAKLKNETRIRSVAVNCWERDSLYEVLDQIITELKVFCAEEHRSTAKLERLQQNLGDQPLIILLDEIDKMPKSERSRVLYSLNDLKLTGLICISDNMNAFFEIEDRVRSRINPRTIGFSAYSAPAITEILTERARLAFSGDVCPAFLVKRIAAACSGDARVAIQTLRNAAESAEQKGHTVFQPSDISAGWHDSQTIKTEQVLARLSEDHRILYQIIQRAKDLLAPQLFSEYRQHCRRHQRQPVAERTFSSYVKQMERWGLLSCDRARVRGNVRLLKVIRGGKS
ncbi:MAG: AAA family ATPase [Planctomycetes bacterium]|nr:AAA family ATPase [Planctomycetota bacterium]